MKNYAHKIATNYKGNEQKKKTNHIEKQQRKTPKILEAFQAMKRIFNIDVYNYENKNDESEINVYSVITTCDSLSENNSNAFQCNRRKRCQTQEMMIESTNYKNSSPIDLKQRQSNDNAVPENNVMTEDRPNFEVTVLTTSEKSDKLKNAACLEHQKPKMNNSQKEKGDVNKKTNKKKPYFICFKCENLVPRAIGITCRKLKCNECQRHNQLYHSEEFLMIHKAKCHYVNEDQKDSETDSTRKEVSTTDKTEESKYYYEIDEDKKPVSPAEKTKISKKSNLGKSNKRRNSKNSIASRFRDDIASKIAKLIRRGNYSSSRGQKDNSNKHKHKHVPFEWLLDNECDTTDTSMPSPCTLSSEARVYVVRANDTRKVEKPMKNVAKRYELVKRNNKLITDNENKQNATTKYLNIGDCVSMTKEKSVSMKFLCDHPSVDKKRLAITNNIKLRVVSSSTNGEQYAEGNKRIPWRTCEKLTENNSKSQPAKVSSGVHREEKEKRPARPKEELRVMRNVNNSEASVFNEDRAISQKPPEARDKNDKNRRQILLPHQTAPGKHFPDRNYAQPPLPLPKKEEMRPNFRPPPFACSHLQSQIPSQFRSSIRPPFINDNCCQNSLPPTLYNYNHRQCLCRDTSGIPKLPWSIMVRRMESLKKINEPPTLKYSHTGNSPTPSLERNQESPLNKKAPILPPKYNGTASRNRRQESDQFQQNLNLGNGLRQKNTSGVASNVPVMPENRHIDVFNTEDQIATRRMSNFHRARQLANNINQQFPGLMI